MKEIAITEIDRAFPFKRSGQAAMEHDPAPQSIQPFHTTMWERSI